MSKKITKKTVVKKATTTKTPVDTKAKKSTRILTAKEKNLFDNRLSTEQKSARDKMIKKLEKSNDVDLRLVLESFKNASEFQKDNIRKHYETNGSMYINAVFKGETQLAKECCPKEDKKLF